MNFLDVRTVILSHLITDAVCAAVLVLLWLDSRKHFAGIGFWVSDLVFQTVAVLLVALRGGIPDWASMILSNTLVVAGALLGYMGLLRFAGIKSRRVHNYILLAAFVAVHTYFVFVQPNLAVRTFNLSAGIMTHGFYVAPFSSRICGFVTTVGQYSPSAVSHFEIC